ncbi:MAG: hypothetical protein HRF51_12935 [bacterium]
MAKLISKKTRETILTVAVIVLIVLVAFFYIIYPLITVPKMTARPDGSRFEDPEFRLANNIEPFVAAGLAPDSFAISSNDNLRLASVRFAPTDSSLKPQGTVILLHHDDTDRTFFMPYIEPLLDSGWSVVLYDQRAAGVSGGIYRFAGSYEADDLIEMVAYLNIHSQMPPPVVAVGFGLGGDAALGGAGKDKRISAVIAVTPYLSSSRWLEASRRKQGALWIPLHPMVYFWWYQKLSGFPFDRTGPDEIAPPETPTTLFADTELLNSKELKSLREKAGPEYLQVAELPSDPEQLRRQLLDAVFKVR